MKNPCWRAKSMLAKKGFIMIIGRREEFIIFFFHKPKTWFLSVSAGKPQ